ncbi:MAG: hypothetical protein IKY85_04610 [Bacteroidaceae bacterium]|nr:hypothetical protein [Bacteroidaceae bacterium]
MYKVFVRSRDLNDATKHYVDILISCLKNLGYEVEFVYSVKEISKKDRVLVITLPGFIKAWLHNPFQDISMWFQGVTPEECGMLFTGVKKYWKIFFNTILDFFAVHVAKRVIFVSETMLRHYRKKYCYRGKNYVIMPCFNQPIVKDAFTKEKYETPSFVYAGSLSKWQCVEETLELFTHIKNELPNATLTLLTGEKEKALELLNKYGIKDAIVKYVPYKELNEELKKHKYGFLIRDDVKVNNVATPTKMNSYMACGIIPVYSNVIGDFKEVFAGMKYKVDVTPSMKETIERIKEIEQDVIVAEDVYCEYKKLFDTYYSEKHYTPLITELFQN